MRVLITGSPGRLARRLYARAAPGDERLFVGRRVLGRNSQRIDLHDAEAVRSLVVDFRPEVIIHLAAVTGAAAELDRDATKAINVTATRTLAEAAIAARTPRIVFASTSAVYGDGYRTPIAESADPDPRSLYAETKLEAEAELAAISALGTLDVVAMRIFNIYGTGFDDSLVWKLRTSTSENPVPLRGFDTFARDYTDADDVATALAVAAAAPMPPGYVVLNVGTGVATSNRDLVELIGREREVHYTVKEASPSYSCAEVSALRRALGLELRPLS